MAWEDELEMGKTNDRDDHSTPIGQSLSSDCNWNAQVVIRGWINEKVSVGTTAHWI